ncbi:hypothetical protein ATANTOWER_004577 [Ataeniobius toweri]|uniref:Uncharacterized protein n=1 Tax=Ataeniobius toweri TaxID=208326 RepID=A0ABU7ANF3_9TELE|nr:hypothetical protein [Ataeniobius toweri]
MVAGCCDRCFASSLTKRGYKRSLLPALRCLSVDQLCCPCVLDPIPARFLVLELTCINSRCLLRIEVSGWGRADSSFLGSPVIKPCSPSTVFTFLAALQESSSWIKPSSREAVQASQIKYTFLWLITDSQTPLIPLWRFIISSPASTISLLYFQYPPAV